MIKRLNLFMWQQQLTNLLITTSFTQVMLGQLEHPSRFLNLHNMMKYLIDATIFLYYFFTKTTMELDIDICTTTEHIVIKEQVEWFLALLRWEQS